MTFLSQRLIVLCTLFLLATNLFGQTQSLPENWDGWLEIGRKDWKIPGMAVGIVKNGEVVYAKGFGHTSLNGKQEVDEHTVFSIASVSKNITAAALAILVDRQTIDWDDPVINYIPWFQLQDPYATREVNIRDLLIHRVGLGRILGNRLQFMTQSNRDEVLRQMRYMEFEKPFRSGYVYNNVMYSLAGQIIPYTDGRNWDKFLQEELFSPLGMTRTTTNLADLEKQKNVAYPHQEIDGTIVPISRRNWDNAGPAGGVNSTVHDMNLWMLMQLNLNPDTGTNLISSVQMHEMHKPQITTSSSHALASQSSYGLGWQIFDYQGKRVWTHSGATDGFNTFMYLVPELELGIFMSGNTFNSFGPAIAYHIIDHFLGRSGNDWHKQYLNNYERRYEQAQQARTAIHNARVPQTQARFDLASYVGTYSSESYGKVEVLLQNNELILRMWDDKNLQAKLEHWHYDTFRAVWENRALREEFLQFGYAMDGSLNSLEIEFNLRPMLLQVGAYPSSYTRKVTFEKD